MHLSQYTAVEALQSRTLRCPWDGVFVFITKNPANRILTFGRRLGVYHSFISQAGRVRMLIYLPVLFSSMYKLTYTVHEVIQTTHVAHMSYLNIKISTKRQPTQRCFRTKMLYARGNVYQTQHKLTNATWNRIMGIKKDPSLSLSLANILLYT
jgi:hypothetical protein